jgi:biotin carboxylase
VRETGDILPARLPAAIRAAALDCTSRVLDALTVRDRVSHTELRVSPTGVDVIEVNGRLGGEVAGMIRLGGGGDLVRAAFEVALGRRPALAPPTAPGYLICLYIPFPERDGVVRSTVSRSQLRALPGIVRVDEVARHGDLRAATAFHAAKVLLAAADPDQVGKVLEAAMAEIAALFAADGLDQDGWLRDMRERLAPPVSGIAVQDAVLVGPAPDPTSREGGL